MRSTLEAMSFEQLPALPPESVSSIERGLGLLDTISSYRYVAAVYHHQDLGVTWFIHAFPVNAGALVTVRVSSEASAHLIVHAAERNIGRIPTWDDQAVRPDGAGPVIEAFAVSPAEVAYCVDITWVDGMLLVAAREPGSFTRRW